MGSVRIQLQWPIVPSFIPFQMLTWPHGSDLYNVVHITLLIDSAFFFVFELLLPLVK